MGSTLAMAAAVAKLAESNASHQLVIASNAKLLTADNLLDLEERPNRDDAHPILETLANAVKAAEEATTAAAAMRDEGHVE